MPAIVLCGSGPSLHSVPWSSCGIDLCAVSTAIRAVTSPKYWVFMDRPTKPEFGPDSMSVIHDADVIKACPDYHTLKRMLGGKPSMRWCRMERLRENESRRAVVRSRSFIGDDRDCYIKPVNASMMLAIQFVVREGYDTLIFAGVDLKTDPDKPYCHDFQIHEKARRGRNGQIAMKQQTHDNLLGLLREWNEVAKLNGIRFLSWTPGSPINTFMECYEHTDRHPAGSGWRTPELESQL